jgi:hypothetical protein
MGVVLAGGFKEVVEAAGLFEIGADDRSHSGLLCPPFPLVSPCKSARDLPKGNEMQAAWRRQTRQLKTRTWAGQLDAYWPTRSRERALRIFHFRKP